MFIRVKEQASGRRYIYLVEGRRRGRMVEQRVLCYLGSLTALAYGIPDDVKKRVEAEKPSISFDWDGIVEQIRKIPLRFEELAEIKWRKYALAVKARSLKLPLPSVEATPRTVFSQRSEGELTALAKLAARGFKETFEQVGDRVYRVKI